MGNTNNLKKINQHIKPILKKARDITPWAIRRNKWYILVITLFLLVVAFLTFFATSDKQNGLNLLADKEYEEALPYLNRSLEFNKDDKNTIFALGQCMEGLGQYEKAIQYYTEALAKDPEYFGAHLGRARCYYKIGEYKYAKKAVEYLIQKGQKLHEAKYLMGMVHMKQSRYYLAVPFFNAVIKAQPKHVNALYHRGVCKSQYNDFSAITDFNNVIELKPTFKHAYYNRGIMYEKKFWYKKAIKDYKKADALLLRKADLYKRMGDCYFQMGNKELSCKWYKKAKTADRYLRIPQQNQVCS